MSKDFDIHEWRLYQANLNLLNEEEEDWNFTAGPEWNEKELKVGSIITPDMWEASKISNSEYDVLLKSQNKLEEYTKIGGDWYVLLIDSSNFRMYWGVNMLNKWLKPGYEIVLPDNLNEEEDEWDLTAGPEWNVKDLGIGDYITPEMLNNTVYSQAWKALNQDFKIVKFKVSKTTLPNGNVNTSNFFVLEYKDRSGKLKRASYNVKHFNDSFLKPGYKVTPPKLNEQDEDEFSQEFIAGPEWNVKELNVGDVVTPDMWDQEKIKSFSISIIRDKGWFLRPHKITRFRQTYLDFVIFDENKELSLNFVKDFLKPNFKIDFPLNEQDEDEWDLEAGPEWNEYDGTVVITYVLEDVGYVYVQEEDDEEFDLLNPNARDNFSYDDEPVRETNVYRSKPIHIRDLISELDELVGIQAQPYTGEKTTKGFKDWMADNGIDIDSFAYLYDILSPNIIKTTYSDEYGNPVKITPEMKNRIDYGDDSTFYGRVIDVKFNDNLTESDNDWDLTAGPEWNEKTLKVGDKLTSEMFQDKTTGKHWSSVIDLTIKKIDWKNNKLTIVGKYNDGREGKVTWDLEWTTKELNPGFEFDRPLNEQDDEWDLEAGPEWNEKEIKVGDYWYESSNPEWNGVWSNYYDIPDRISDLVLKVIYIGPHKEEFLNQPYDIPNYYGEYVIISKRNGKFWAFTVDYFNNNFGPKLNAYVPTDNLNESDDEWDLEAGPEWNETLLSLGDKITPDMWDEKAVIDAGEEDEFLNDEIWTINYIRNGWGIDMTSNGGGSLSWDIDDVQALLKPQYKIVVKKDLFEEDEWDFEAGPEWNVKELNVGDIVTPDMWDEDKLRYFEDNISSPLFFTKPHKITRIEKTYFDFVWFDNEKKENLYFSNTLLKPQYRIVQPLNEQEDEDWDFEAGDEWNVTELGIGDTITSNMWNKNLSPEYGNIGDWIDNPAENQTIDSIDTDDHGVVGIWFTGKKSNIQNIYTLEDFNNLLDPKYRIIPPLTESENKEWDLEAGPEWGVQELTTGDIITPDMWNNDLPDEWYDEFQGWELEIDDFQAGNEVVVLIGSGVYYVDLEEFNSYLEPKYQIVPPLNESEDDEWDLEAGEEWNTKELTTGDYITPDMWDWQEIGAFIDRMNDGDHEEYRRDWEEWEEGTKNPIKILKIHGSGVSTYPELDSYLFRWGPNIRFINQMLKPGFEVIST